MMADTPGNGSLVRTLGGRVAALRKQGAQGRMSQGELAKRVGISLSYMEKIERGVRPATVDVVEAMAIVLGVGPHDLICDGALCVSPRHVARFAEMLERHQPEAEIVEMCLAVVEAMMQQLGGFRLVRRRHNNSDTDQQ